MVIASCSSSLEDFKNENDALKKQVEDLTSTLVKFTQGIDNLDVLLGGQNKSLNKSGLGFNCIEKQKSNEHFNQSAMYTTCKEGTNDKGKKGLTSKNNKLEETCI
ncbi:hypothetical protein NC652_011272 [Populus alba x Populus x berolinensis]|nr:hypothetical protein NC652_011272 [Populus alba x Populus x berolinensis]